MNANERFNPSEKSVISKKARKGKAVSPAAFSGSVSPLLPVFDTGE